MENKRVYVKVLRGFLANTTEDTHPARKIMEDGKVYYEVNYGGYRVGLSPDFVEEIAPIETYWFVKEVSTATPANKNFYGEVHTYIFGKDGFRLYEDVPGGFFNRDLTDCPYCIVENGYKRPCDAKRNYSYTHPTNDEFWTSTVQLVSLDVQKDKDGKYHIA